MTNKTTKQQIEQALENDKRLFVNIPLSTKQTKPTTEFNQTALIDLLERYDAKILKNLFDNKHLKDQFFIKAGNAWVFKLNDFKFFIEENKVDNSYTQYQNKIGLSVNNQFIKDTEDVVLNFPFKDGILEGGQSSDDGKDNYYQFDEKVGKKEANKGHKPKQYNLKQAKRKEVFFNQTLAKDEIDRLNDAKALVNWKRYTKEGEQKVGEIKRDANGNIKENLIIKGNNYLALHSIKAQFAGKVKLIYIDPPYNTGNDSFNYNDNFNHSTWLAFMKNRLEVARDLLRDDGVIFVQCDDNEQAYLKVLMDEVFGRDNFVNNIIWHKKNVVQNDAKYFSENHDHILVLCRNKNNWIPNLLERTEVMNARYKNLDSDPKGEWTSVALQAKSGTKDNVYEIEFANGVKWKPVDGTYPRLNKKSLQQAYDENRLWFGTTGKNVPRLKKYLCEVKQGLISNTIFANEYAGSTQQGKEELKKILNQNIFTTPKPEKLLKRIIELSTKKGEIVLDYHLGSATTCAVAHKMERQYIGIEQMDYIEDIAVKRMQKVIEGEQGGISKAVKWQDGGDFVYFELAKWNEQAIELINKCKNLTQLSELFTNLADQYFLNYNVKVLEFQTKIIKEADFKKLSLDQQKQIFCTMLDLNQMSVQKTEMADAKYKISKSDQVLTKEFYGDVDDE